MTAFGVVHTAHLHHGRAAPQFHRLVAEQAHARGLDDCRVRGPHEGRVALAVVVVAQHAQHAHRRLQAAELALELVEAVAPHREVAGDDHEVRVRASAMSTALRMARRL